MSIASEIQRLKLVVANAYLEAERLGATIPVNRNIDNLPDCLATISIAVKLLTKNNESLITKANENLVIK
ncbi:MAG: hypothetical protein IKO49_02235 [Bacilli bacterium]|nr:hypothetical protein [Clostridia bacterium]MBR4618100.1 hypothetical protein [Bacilli bacterium]